MLILFSDVVVTVLVYNVLMIGFPTSILKTERGAQKSWKTTFARMLDFPDCLESSIIILPTQGKKH